MANEDTSRGAATRERTFRRAVESVSLSDQSAGTRVTEIVRNRLDDGSQRVVITHAAHDLPTELIEHAFDALRYSAIVCAPGDDGDIALIGMSAPHDALLGAIRWGSSAALDELLSAARERQVPVTLLPPASAGRDTDR